MKNYFLLIVIAFTVSVNAQSHEVKADVLDLIAFTTLDLSYQYNLNEESSIGLSIYMPLTDKASLFDSDLQETFRITPYYRHYFVLGGAGNFFADAFVAINSGKVFFQNSAEKKYTDGAFGFTIGKAYISPRGFVLEGLIGAGRNLFRGEDKLSPNVVAHFAINIGYRFE